MSTALPKVTVTHTEAGHGFLITCSRCPSTRTIRPTRYQADLYATEHRASHQTPVLADQVDGLDTFRSLIGGEPA